MLTALQGHPDPRANRVTDSALQRRCPCQHHRKFTHSRDPFFSSGNTNQKSNGILGLF
jgi:hypothetical protein